MANTPPRYPRARPNPGWTRMQYWKYQETSRSSSAPDIIRGRRGLTRLGISLERHVTEEEPGALEQEVIVLLLH